MSLHTWCCQGPCKPSSSATFILSSQWSRTATGKKVLCLFLCQLHTLLIVVALVMYKSLQLVGCELTEFC